MRIVKKTLKGDLMGRTGFKSVTTKRRGAAFSSSGMRRRPSCHHRSSRDGIPGRSRRTRSKIGGNRSNASSGVTNRTTPAGSNGSANASHSCGILISPAHEAMP